MQEDDAAAAPLGAIYALSWLSSRDAPSLSVRELTLLLLLHADIIPPTVKATADAMGSPKSAVVRAMNKLVQLNYATRHRHVVDRRCSDMLLTATGKKMVRTVHKTMQTMPFALHRNLLPHGEKKSHARTGRPDRAAAPTIEGSVL